MMGKMGLGLLGFVGKSLLSGGGAAGSVLSAVGKKCAGGAGKGGGRNQNAAPLEEAFAALLDKDRAATGARLETASRPELAPFTPMLIKSATCAPRKLPLPEKARLTPDVKRHWRRSCGISPALRTGACACGTKPLRNRPFMRPCARPWSKRGSLLRWNSRRPPVRYFCAMTPDV